jgi:peptidoglycan/xylan/chitin deacetylase (PgdA/CDA1 family)
MNTEISFDDCNVSDIKAAKILTKYGFKGTFYMPSNQVKGTQLLSLKEVFKDIIGLGHEIGGHTVSHPMDMKLLTDEQLKFEIENNKFLCELLMKRHVTKFCYPRGRHDERVRAAVKAAGYKEARTTEVLQTRNVSDDPFQTPTTVHMFQRDEYNGLHWFDMAKSYFMKAKHFDETFSLWTHYGVEPTG